LDPFGPSDRLLAGIIQNAEPDIVKLVEDIVISNIKGNTIILVALPMTGPFMCIDDFGELIRYQTISRTRRHSDSHRKKTVPGSER
jgi:hypothetical protein